MFPTVPDRESGASLPLLRRATALRVTLAIRRVSRHSTWRPRQGVKVRDKQQRVSASFLHFIITGVHSQRSTECLTATVLRLSIDYIFTRALSDHAANIHALCGKQVLASHSALIILVD